MLLDIRLFRVLDRHGAPISDWSTYYDTALELVYSANLNERPCSIQEAHVQGEHPVTLTHTDRDS